MIIKKHNRAGILCYWDDSVQNITSRKEKFEQIDLVSHSKIRPEVQDLGFHPVNESMCDVKHRSNLKKYGLKAGVSDWIILFPVDYHPYMILELKRANKKEAASISPEQKDFLLNAGRVGAFSVCAYGYLAALEAIDDYFSNKT